MKYLKLFALAAMTSVTMLASAAITSQALISVASPNNFSDHIQIYEKDVIENGCGLDIMNNMPALLAVNMWAQIGNDKFSEVELTSIDGLEIHVKANQAETHYTMSFLNLGGTAFQLRRESNQELIPVGADEYEFDCAVNAEEVFTIVMPQPENVYLRQLNAGQQWGTICMPESIDHVVGADLYKVAGMEGDILYLDEVAAPQLGVPYIFKADGSVDPVKFYIDGAQGEANAPVEALGLVGTFEELNAIPEGMFVITNNVVKAAAAGSHVAERRAYLDLSEVPAPAAPAPGIRRVRMHIADVATALENVAVKADGKRLINGQLVIIRNGARYNATGKLMK